MTKDEAFEILLDIHISGDYYNLNDTSTCLDGDFTAQQLKALAYIMENKLTAEIDSMIREFIRNIRSHYEKEKSSTT